MQLKSVGASLSTRQLLRIARRLAVNPSENMYDVVQKACLGRCVQGPGCRTRCFQRAVHAVFALAGFDSEKMHDVLTHRV